MEPQIDSAKEEKSELNVLKKSKSRKRRKETHFKRMMNWLEDRKIYAYPAIILVILSTIIGLCVAVIKIYDVGKNVVHDVKTRVEQSHTTYSAMMKNPDAKEAMEIVKNYFQDMEYGKFKAANYFASHVDKYILVPNLNPAKVDSFYVLNSREFLSPISEILDTAFSFLKDENGNKTLDFWTKFSFYRKSKGKYEHGFSRLEFVFDKTNKIKVLTELNHKDIKFSESLE